MRTLAAALAVLLAAPAAALRIERVGASRTASGATTGGIEVVSGEALVKFDPLWTRAQREVALASRGASYLSEVGSTGWSHAALPTGMSVEAGLTVLRAIPGLLEAAPNHAYRPTKAPNDLNFWTQYHLDKINAPQAWDDEDGSTNRVTIAVLDAGVEGSHPEFAGKFIGQSQFCNPGPSKATGLDNVACAAEPSGAAIAACNHGTRVAGVALAATNNNALVAGVSWGARLVSLRTFRTEDCDPGCALDTCATDDTATVSAIDYARTVLAADAVTYGKVIVNASIGGPAASCNGGSALDVAIDNAAAAGVMVIASAGNNGGAVNSPGNCDNATPVGSTNSQDSLSSFSSVGAEMGARGVLAPGEAIVTTDLGGKITPAANGARGTSFSAPIVSGLAALIWSRNNLLTVAQVRDHIRNGADSIGIAANSQGTGRVNACKSLKLAQAQAVTSCLSGTSGLAGFRAEDKVVAFPNPLRTTDVRGSIIKIPPDMRSGSPIVKVYTMDGVLVKTITSSLTAAVWDGLNESGFPVASGTYLVMVKAGSTVRQTKLAVIR